MWRKALLSLLVGALFYIIGSVFAGPAKTSIATAEPATLIVLQVDEKHNHDGDRAYRPVFALETKARPRPEYAGSIWVSPKPHQPGDIVEGRYDPVSGEMRSNKMASRSFWVGRVAQIIGILLLLQGVLMFFGFPEFVPIRVRSRHC